MASKIEIEDMVSIYSRLGCDLILMHCTSEYPTPADHSNVQRISTLSEQFKVPIGFSDHTVDETAAVMAVALGSKIFEKHITLNKSDRGPDHAASLNFAEFAIYTSAIRQAEKTLGNGNHERTSAEELMAQTSRKSLHLSRNLKKGDQLTVDDLILMRPGTGLFWAEAKNILGKHALMDLPKLYLISEDDFE
jgi:sialic acid synthase SpsE